MAHSTDLRERIINAVIHKRYTLQKAADTFDVGAATVSRYLRRYRQTGDLTPRTSPGRPSALNEYQAWVEQSLISNDLTHDQRCDLLFDEIGVRISRATIRSLRWDQKVDEQGKFRTRNRVCVGQQGISLFRRPPRIVASWMLGILRR